MFRIARTLVAAIALTAAQCGLRAAAADEFEAVRGAIRNYVAKQDVTSISVAAVRGGKIVWLESFGWSDRESRVAATPHTPYMLASASKPITATAVMVAVQQKRLTLDVPLNGYLGNAKIRSRSHDAGKVTVRDVLMHRGGIANYSEAYFLNVPYRPASRDEQISTFGWTMMPHGEFHYSNLGYSLLADAVERSAGKNFAAFVDEFVFSPLGMHDSFVPEQGKRRSSAAARYGADGRRLREFATSTSPAAEIHASARDLARFALFHLKQGVTSAGALLSAACIDEMQSSAAAIRFFRYEYGLGWSIGRDVKQRRHVFHGGGFADCDCLLTLLPEQNVAVVLLSNKNRVWPGRAVSEDIVQRTLAGLLGEQPESFQIDYSRLTQSEVDPSPGKLVGNWRGKLVVGEREVPLSLHVDADGKAHAKLGDRAAAPLENVEFISGALLGTMQGRVNSPASRLPDKEHLAWDLRPIDDVLQGVLYVNCPSDGDGYLLPYWARLERGKPPP